MSLLKISLSVFLLACMCNLQAQSHAKKTKITEQSIVIDPGGGVLPYSIWQKLIMTGEYALKRGNNDTLLLTRLSEKDKEQREVSISGMPKPVKSKSFFDNEKMYKIKARDIYGNKINTKELKGKIIVLNFWFINCPPCKMEIPHLNKLVADYKNDTGVVFLGIALDNTTDIADFLKTSPFNYTLIANGRDLNNSSNITGFPTNVVVDKEGKVYFHTVGFATNTVYWIRKSIEEIKAHEYRLLDPKVDRRNKGAACGSTINLLWVYSCIRGKKVVRSKLYVISLGPYMENSAKNEILYSSRDGLQTKALTYSFVHS